MTITNHENLSPFYNGGGGTDIILKHDIAGSVTPHFNLPFSPSLLVELLMASSTTFDNNVTGAYLTPGVKFGGRKYSFGAGAHVPFGS